MRSRWWMLLPVLALAGCASIVPPELAPQVNRRVTGAELLGDPERYRGQTIIVGGVILAVRNRPGESELELLERPLDQEEPMLTDRSAGRFLVDSNAFLDPAIYAVGRRVTVVGTVEKDLERKIDDVEYRYPVVEGRFLKLWPVETVYYRYPSAYYDPFWGPYWYRYPFCDPFWCPPGYRRY